MRVLSTLAVKGVLDALGPAIEARLGVRPDIRYDPTAVLLAAIKGGATGDVALLTRAGIDALARDGILQAGSAVDLARSKIGLAVRAGAPRPAIATPDDVVATLRDASSVCYSAAGASGQTFTRLLASLGIADIVNARALVIPAGFTAEAVRDGRAALAVQQVSELMAVDGVEVLGPLPDEMQEDMVFSGAAFALASGPQAAAFLRLISDPCHAPLYRSKGLFDL